MNVMCQCFGGWYSNFDARQSCLPLVLFFRQSGHLEGNYLTMYWTNLHQVFRFGGLWLQLIGLDPTFDGMSLW